MGCTFASSRRISIDTIVYDTENILSMKLANFSNLPHKQHVPTFRTIAYHHHAFPFAASSNLCHVPTLFSQGVLTG